MRPHCGAVDENLHRRPACLRQSLEEIDPHAFLGPTDIAVVERFLRPVFRRSVDPSTAGLSTWTMPLITRRSSTRALPRVSVGRCGAIFENCASVSQNCSKIIGASFGSRESRYVLFRVARSAA